MLKSITKYIENESGYEIGINLFAGFVPSTIDNDYIVVIETGGRPQPDLKDYIEKSIQVMVSAKEYFSAVAMANDIYDILHSAAGISLPVVVAGKEYFANTISAISGPQSLGQDDRGKFVLSTNYIFKIKDKNQ